MKNNGLTLKDYENAVATAVDQLHIMYANNGGAATEKTVHVLFKNMNRISKYPGDLLEAILNTSTCTPGNEQKLMDIIQPIVNAIKK